MLTHLFERPTPPQRVVVIGAGGFVGAAVVKLLAAQAIPTLALSRRDVDLLAPGAASALAAHLREGDAVVAVSALAPVKNTAMLADNMRMVDAMLGALAAAPIAHMVNISSDAIYADAPLPLTESSCTAPVSLHGAMHVAREVAFRCEIKAPLAMVRPTLIYGAADPHNGYGPNRFRRLAEAGQKIVLFGEGEERRDHVLIDDVAEIILRVLLHRSSGAVNAATGEVHSFRSIAEQVVALSPTKPPIEGSPRQGAMPHGGYRPFDISALRAAFPDLRMTPLAEGLKRVAAQTKGRAA